MDTVDAKTVDRLTSMAVGLAFSGRDGSDAVRELVDVAGGDPAVLRDARSRVVGLQVGDPGTRQQATSLLDMAARRCELGPSDVET